MHGAARTDYTRRAAIGIVGVIFATPLTACAMVLIKRLYVEDVLGEHIE